MKGDVITKLNGVKVKTSTEFRTQLYKYNVGDEITVTYVREGKEVTQKVTLAKTA